MIMEIVYTIVEEYMYGESDKEVRVCMISSVDMNAPYGSTTRDIFRMYKECKNFRRALPLKYRSKIPLVFDAHSSIFELYAVPDRSFYTKKKFELQEKLLLNASDKVVAVSEELKIFFLQYFHIPAGKIELVKNGVDTNSLRPTEPDVKLTNELGISDDDKVIVFTCPRVFFSNDIALKYFFK